MNTPIHVRVLEHYKDDQIRISAAFSSNDLETTVEKIKNKYETKLERYGGYKVACAKHFKRIALVDAVKFSTIRLIYNI